MANKGKIEIEYYGCPECGREMQRTSTREELCYTCYNVVVPVKIRK